MLGCNGEKSLSEVISLFSYLCFKEIRIYKSMRVILASCSSFGLVFTRFDLH